MAGASHFDQQFLFYRTSNEWWRGSSQGLARWRSIGGGPSDWILSGTNQALLRGVAWAVPSEVGAPGVVDSVEGTVASAMAYTGSSRRAPGTANTAIGAIARIGTREALEGLLDTA